MFLCIQQMITSTAHVTQMSEKKKQSANIVIFIVTYISVNLNDFFSSRFCEKQKKIYKKRFDMTLDLLRMSNIRNIK